MDIFGNQENSIGHLKSDISEYEHPVEIEARDILEEKGERPRFQFFYVVIVLASLILVGRLLDLQITRGAEFQTLAEGNRIRSRMIESPRGLIYDREGKPLVKNTGRYNLELVPADLPRGQEEREKIYAVLQEIGLNTEGVKGGISQAGLYSMEPLVLKENLTYDEAILLKIKLQSFSGVGVVSRPIRVYENILGLSHILGYVGKVSQDDLKNHSNYNLTDKIGKSGLELVYDEYLKGTDGQEQVEVDSSGQIQRVLRTLEYTAGNDLYLTLDLGLQDKLAGELARMVSERKTYKAVAMAMNPQNGEILAMVSLPSYDNNIFSQELSQDKYNDLVNDKNNPLLNRSVAGEYPSGSTIKPFIAAAGLQEGTISENTTINDPGEIRIGEWVFPDWKNHGLVDVKKAIAESCNDFFYAVGGGWDKIKGLGANKIKDYLGYFGFGQKTGVDLDGERAGFLPDPNWKKKVKKESWYIGDTYHLAIGQGDLLVTPIQLLVALSAIANGGEVLKPHFIHSVTNQEGTAIKTIDKEIIKKDFIGGNNLEIIREGMRQTVTSGSARQLADLVDKNGVPVAAAGKTGTAQFGDEGKTHAWFVSFAPYNNPQIALTVLVEGGGEGYDTAAPVAKEALRYWFNR